MAHLSREEVDKIKEEQQIRTGVTIKTVLKTYFGFVGVILLLMCLAIILCAVVPGVFALIYQVWQMH